MDSLLSIAILALFPTLGSDEPRELWRAELGPGNASPLLDERSGNVVSLLREGERSVLVAHACESGEERWRFAFEDAGHEGQQDYGGGRGPHATPLAHRGLVIAIGYAGRLVALEAATGEERWSHGLVEDFGAEPVSFGFAASPVAAGETLYCASGGKSGVIAFDVANGEVIWRTGPFKASYVTPVLVELEGERQLVALFEDETVGFDPENGEELWRVPHVRAGLTNFAMVSAVDGSSIVVSGQGNLGTRRIDVRRGSAPEPSWSASVRWHARGVKLSHGRVLEREGFLYGSNGSMLCCLRLEDGAVAFKERGFGECTLIDGGEWSYALDEEGRLSRLELTPERIGVWAQSSILVPKAWATPLRVGERMYLRDREKLVALQLPARGPDAPLRTIETGFEPERLRVAPALLAFACGGYARGEVRLELGRGEGGALSARVDSGVVPLEARSDDEFVGPDGERLVLLRKDEGVVPFACDWSSGAGRNAARFVREPIETVSPDESLRAFWLGDWVIEERVGFTLREEAGVWSAASAAYRGVDFAIEIERGGRLWLRASNASYGIPPLLIERNGAELRLHQESDTRTARRP